MAEQTPNRESLLLTDFATLFAHMWYRDFPLRPTLRERAQRADWTTHIGLSVRSAADQMGLFTHFESGGRTDAVLKDNRGKPVAALEWEWEAIHKRDAKGDEIVTEFNKLKDLCSTEEFQGIRFACLIGYARVGPGRGRGDYKLGSERRLASYVERWTGELPPLLLVLVHFEARGDDRLFTTMTVDEIKAGARKRLREQPAYPWKVNGSRWEREGERGSPVFGWGDI